MKRFLISILLFLLTIFPNCSGLKATYDAWSFPGRAAVSDNIMTAIKENDVEALADMLNDHYKENFKDINGRFIRIIEAIEGEIVGGHLCVGSSSSSGPSGSSESWDIIFETTEKSYEFYVVWVISDKENPEWVGMYNIVLYEIDETYEEGYKIVARL